MGFYSPWSMRLLCFAVSAVAAAKAAVLREFETVGIVLLVLLRVIVPALALLASEDNHHAILFFGHFVSLDGRAIAHLGRAREAAPWCVDSA